MLFIVKKTTFPGPFDLLAPHSCRGCGRLGSVFCECCKKYLIAHYQNFCPNCKKLNPTGKCKTCKNLPPIFVVDERKNIIGKLIHDLKFRSTRALVKPLAEILNETLPFIDGPVTIVPLPTIPRHIRERALDHTFLIAKTLARLRNYEVKKLLLRDTNHVQVGSDAKTRLIQAKSAYKINPKIPINDNTTYLLFDDVWTTGASMKSALKKLRESGAKKIIISILAVNRLN